MIGTLTRLAAVPPAEAAELFARWRHDSEYSRLLDADPQGVETPAQVRRRLEDYEPGDMVRFLIRLVADDRAIGFVNIWPNWHHREAWIGIGIGDAADRGKGYGTDAMRLALRFVFDELEMERASLGVLADNERAVRSYQQIGRAHV